jgi:hypothetical protein
MRHAARLIPLLLLAACARDPYDRRGTWSIPDNALSNNDANLRTMVADPRDLVAGTGEANSTGSEAGAPVRRLLTGRRAPLQDVETSTLQTGAGSQPNSGAGAGVGAGSNATQ